LGIRWSASSWDFAAGWARPNTVRAYEASPGPGATDDLVETLSREGLTAAWSLERLYALLLCQAAIDGIRKAVGSSSMRAR
jgi:hypothetical protein